MKLKGWAVIDPQKGFYKTKNYQRDVFGFSVLSTPKSAAYFQSIHRLPLGKVIKKVTVIVED